LTAIANFHQFRDATSGGVGAECDSVFARLFECHAADGQGLR
jgi:hypothetical protein